MRNEQEIHAGYGYGQCPLKPAIRQALVKASKTEMRTISSYLEYRLADLLRKEGFLKGART